MVSFSSTLASTTGFISEGGGGDEFAPTHMDPFSDGYMYIHTFPAVSRAFLFLRVCPLSALTSRAPAISTTGTMPRITRERSHVYANAMTMAATMPIIVSITVPSRVPVAWGIQK